MMEQLIKNPELAGQLRDYLDQQISDGHQWVVYDTDNAIGSIWDLNCFKDETQAVDFAKEYQQIFNWHEAVPITDLAYALIKIEYSLKDKHMNRNSLEDFQANVKHLKIPAEMAKEAIEKMEQNLQYIQITQQLPSRKGYMEATLHLKRSEQSDYYFLNKYDLAYSKAKPLENDNQYIVSGMMEINGEVKSGIKKFDSPIQAIAHFKKMEGNAELYTGKVGEDGKIKTGQSLATMKEGKVDYVTKDFQLTFNTDPMKNTIYINQGKGFNMTQSSNMLMGGSAYRDDLVSRAGQQYSAWNEYQFDQPRDRYGNMAVRQYGEGYPFNLGKELESYKIKELDEPKKLGQIIAQMKDGERPLVTVTNDKGEELRMMARAMPRYGNINFYNLDGQLQKREQFKKDKTLEMAKGNIFEKKLQKNKQKGQELSI